MKPREVLATLGPQYGVRFQRFMDRKAALEQAMAVATNPDVARSLVDLMVENRAELNQIWADVGAEYDIDVIGQALEFDRKLCAAVRK